MPHPNTTKGFMLCLLCLVFCSCSKKNDLPAGISCSSNLYVNKVIRFSCGGATQNSSWNFGDGATASGKDVTHTYTQSGQYKVTLETPGAGAFSKTLAISPDSAIMASLVGTMTFHKTDSMYRNLAAGDTVAATGIYADTTITIAPGSTSSLLFYGDTLSFDSVTHSAVYFHYNSPFDLVNPYMSTFTLNLITSEKRYIRRKHIMSSATEITHLWVD